MAKTLKEHKIAALQHAYKQIESGNESWICAALDRYRNSYGTYNNEVHQAKEYLINFVQSALGDNVFLSGWIEEKLEGKFIYDSKKLRRTRLAWIKWMLKCYGAKP